MSIARDLRIIGKMALGAATGGDDHGVRMEKFYAGQAADYDEFRKRLLPGRSELLNAIDWPEQAVVVDLGGGTGANLEFLSASTHRRILEWTIVDLSKSLLGIASERIRNRAWAHVKLVEADACDWTPAQPADVILLSYSLTMIPDWQAVLSHAKALLKPGGQIGVVDFTITHPDSNRGIKPSSTFARLFWPKWFAWDGVYLNPDHLPFLLGTFNPIMLEQALTRLPYLPGSRVPYFWFVGEVPRGDEEETTTS